MLTVYGIPTLRWADAVVYRLHLFLRAWVELFEDAETDRPPVASGESSCPP